MSEGSGNQRDLRFPKNQTNPLSLLGENNILSLRGILWGLFCSFAITFFITGYTPSEYLNPEEVDKQVVADREIRALFGFQTEDVKATLEARKQAKSKVPPHYKLNKELVKTNLSILNSRIKGILEVKKDIYKYIKTVGKIPSPDEIKKELRKYLGEDTGWVDNFSGESLSIWFSDLLSADIMPGEKDLSLYDDMVNVLGDVATKSLEYLLLRGIKPSGENVLPDDKIVVIRELSTDVLKSTEELLWKEIPNRENILTIDLKKVVIQECEKTITNQPLKISCDEVYKAIKPIISDLIVETIQYDAVTTDLVRERSAEEVQPIMKEIAAGEIIQERGKRWTLESRSDAKTYFNLLKQSQGSGVRWIFSYLSNLIIVVVGLLGFYRAIQLWEHKGEPYFETIWNLGLSLLLAISMAGRGMQYFDPTGFSVPVAVVGMLFAILVQVRLSAYLSFIACVFVSIIFKYDWQLLVFYVAMTFGSIFMLHRVRKRSDMTSASFIGILFGLIMLIAITLTTESISMENTFRRFLLLGVNGGLCILAVPGLLPFLERWFNIVTDFQLLEYSDLNHELLKRLAVEAPSTYSHSLTLGQLAEASADAIGANGLLARVCAYYHDIGKLLRPEYFCENQNGINIHDNLTPRSSARIIMSHVQEGIKLAQRYKLPKPIIDAIAQHHGTLKIAYFYHRALEQQKYDDVEEVDYRYPGPKPQKPEYAILMICDACESAVRAIRHANPERIRQMVDKIVTERANDGQFDECDLTLKQLNIIVDVVARILFSIHHTRVAYPTDEQDNKQTNGNGKANSDKTENGKEKTFASGKKINGETLK